MQQGWLKWQNPEFQKKCHFEAQLNFRYFLTFSCDNIDESGTFHSALGSTCNAIHPTQLGIETPFPTLIPHFVARSKHTSRRPLLRLAKCCATRSCSRSYFTRHVGHLRFFFALWLRPSFWIQDLSNHITRTHRQSTRLLQQPNIEQSVLLLLLISYRTRWLCYRQQRTTISGRQHVVVSRIRSRIGSTRHDELPDGLLVCFWNRWLPR